MNGLSDKRMICLFSILCFGKVRETPFLGKGCQAYDFNANTISIQCKHDYELSIPSTVRDIHTLLLDKERDESFTLHLINLPFKHLIIRNWDMSNHFKVIDNYVFTCLQRQSLTAFSVSNLQAWQWADFEFEQIYIEKSSLTRIGAQRLNNLIAKRLFSHKVANIYIIDCQLLSIDPDVFSHTPSLKTLTVSRNTLSTVHSSSFPSKLHHLWLLDLSYNRLTSLDKDLFEKLPALVELNLNNNQLVDLPQDLIKPVWFNLNLIQLSDNRLNCRNLCWALEAESYPHPISFDQTDCSYDYTKGLMIGTMNKFIPICSFPWNLMTLHGQQLVNNSSSLPKYHHNHLPIKIIPATSQIKITTDRVQRDED